MAKTHQLSQKERLAIDSDYADCILYKWLKPLTLQWGNEAADFSLAPAEAFYHVVCSLDELFSAQDKSERVEYCQNLCNVLYEHFLEAVNAKNEDCKRAACLVTGALDACLYALRHELYLDEIVGLKTYNDYRRELQQMFKPWMRSDRNATLVEWLSAYSGSEECISATIEEKILTMRHEEYKAQEEARLRQTAEVYVQGDNCGIAAKTINLTLPDGMVKKIGSEQLNKLISDGDIH